MPPALTEVLQFFFFALTSVFFLVDRIAAIPTFLAMAGGHDALQRRDMAKRADITCFVVLAGVAAAGKPIFRLFGVTLPAFKIAGGVILLLTALGMLRARCSATKETPGEAEEGAVKEHIGIIPLGIPMLAGPGAISTVTPQGRGIRKQIVRYKREDGVPLSFTLYLPPDYKEGTCLPTMFWAYPLECNDADTAGQAGGSSDRFTQFGGASPHLLFLLHSWIVMDSKAAIDKTVELGVADRARSGRGKA